MVENKFIDEPIDVWSKDFVFKEPTGVIVEYDPVKAYDKLCNLSSLVLGERLTYANHLADLLNTIGIDIAPKLPEILKILTNETDEITMALLK